VIYEDEWSDEDRSEHCREVQAILAFRVDSQKVQEADFSALGRSADETKELQEEFAKFAARADGEEVWYFHGEQEEQIPRPLRLRTEYWTGFAIVRNGQVVDTFTIKLS
jgi:hypothetical protein